jgi:hypothetical protein
LRNQAEASDGLKIYEIATLAQALLREDASFQPYQVLEADGRQLRKSAIAVQAVP